jgi:hypothetical protein
MSTDRHRATVDTSELYAEAARKAEEEGQHARAALLYWAAAMVLDGHSADEVQMMLEERSLSASMRLWRDKLPHRCQLPQLSRNADVPTAGTETPNG